MNVTFYQFSKRENSTARPGGGAGYNVTLKEPSSVTAPVISLVWTGAGSPVVYNYAWIPAFLRYYFVRNWTYAERQWTAELDVDPLASWKTYIGSSTKYILRCETDTYVNKWMQDGKYPVSLEQHFKQTATSNMLYRSPAWTQGVYIAGLICANDSLGSGASGVTYYAMDYANAYILVKSMMQQAIDVFDPAHTSISDIGEALATFGSNLVKSLVNPMQFLVSFMWMPVPPANTGGLATITVGSFATPAEGYQILDPVLTITDTLAIPDMPLTDKYWQHVEPVANYTLEYMPFGLIPLAGQDLIRHTAIHPNITVDFVTGLANLRVMVGDDDHGGVGGFCIASRTAQVGVQMAVGNTTTDNAGALMNIAGAAADAVSENYVGMASSILSAAKDVIPQARSSGNAGGFSGLNATDRVSLIKRYSTMPDEDPEEFGRPSCKKVQISNLSGFVQVADGDIKAPATIRELAAIKAFLEGGFFYE